MPQLNIQLVLQSASHPAARMEIPGDWKKTDTIQNVLISIKDRLFGVDMANSSIRYLQTVVESRNWETTTLGSMGLEQGGRALLILQTSAPTSAALPPAGQQQQQQYVNSNSNSNDDSMESDHPLEAAIQQLLDNNFDADSKVAIVTLLKIIDNILSKPYDPKLRMLKLSNAVVQKKIATRLGAGTFVVSCSCYSCMFSFRFYCVDLLEQIHFNHTYIPSKIPATMI